MNWSVKHLIPGIRSKYRKVMFSLRSMYFKIQGGVVGKGVRIGKVNCEWPGRISIGRGSVIENGVVFWIKNPFDPNNRIVIGENTYVGRNCEFNCSDSIIIGDNCLIGSNTIFVDTSHSYRLDNLINNQELSIGEIRVGSDVWIGSGALVLKGVSIGNGSVIGAGSIINKGIPESEVWAGVPARKIKERE